MNRYQRYQNELVDVTCVTNSAVMRTLQLSDHLTNDQLIEKLSSSRGTSDFTRWQILYLVQVVKQVSADIISPLVGLSKPSIYKIVERL